MKTRRSSGFVLPLLLLFTTGLLLAVAHSKVADSVSVQLQIEQRKSTTPLKIYWRQVNEGFTESQSTAANILPGDQTISLWFRSGPDLSQIRLDIDAHPEETISVSRLRVVRDNCLLPVSKWCVADWTGVDPISVHDAEVFKNQTLVITTLGQDPYLIWDFPTGLKSQKKPLLNNILVVTGLFLAYGLVIGLWFSGEIAKLAPAVLRSLPVLFVYPVMIGLQYLSEPFFKEVFLERAVFLFSAILFLVLILGQVMRGQSLLGRSLRITIFVVFGSIVAIDISFHLGFIGSWRYGSETAAYHWKLGRSFDSNYQHSSLKYERDLVTLDHDIQLSGRALSDVATSVYLASTTKLSVVNPFPHHRIARRSVTDSDIDALCDKDSSWQILREILARLEVDYVVINHDRENPNVVRSCSSLRTDQLMQRFQGSFRLVYDGEFLSAYQVLM